MNTIREIQSLNKRELEHAVSTEASWHADYRDTAYIYIGGLSFDLSEGDIVTIFSQFGEPVHVNLVRDKDTGKSKGFAFLKYEDQRSTDLAVDNLGGASIMGRVLKVDHTRYKRKDDEAGENDQSVVQAFAEDGDERDHRPRGNKREKVERGESESTGRPVLKEERELAELIRNHDEDDPMKGYLIKEKEEEVELVLAKLKKSNKEDRRHRDGTSRRHRHHHSKQVHH
ncbi:MAG: hypothetical protein M1812_003331 [Candelaria pacifica]|nr:MAG: hypothetical protein M1812_003331 [Candelaria pacifica]